MKTIENKAPAIMQEIITDGALALIAVIEISKIFIIFKSF